MINLVNLINLEMFYKCFEVTMGMHWNPVMVLHFILENDGKVQEMEIADEV